MLSLSQYYIYAKRFINLHDRFEYGKVVHGFSAAIRTILQDYLTLLTKLEGEFRNGKLSIQKLWFHVQSPLINMKLIYTILQEVSKQKARGGILLNLLYDRYMILSGDPLAKNMVGFLLETASMPYFNILEQWIHRGIVDDPFLEFMVEEHSNVKKEMLSKDFNDAYWEQRYILRKEYMLHFLEHYKEKILSTGKYLNVIKECNATLSDLPSLVKERVIFNLRQPNYAIHIDTMYDYASKKLLEILKQDFHLLQQLR
jgi:gamma-tubulin complex component 2